MKGDQPLFYIGLPFVKAFEEYLCYYILYQYLLDTFFSYLLTQLYIFQQKSKFVILI